MSDLTQIKTISGEYSGFNDTVARESITELSGAIDYVSGAVTGAGGGTTVVSGIDNGLIYISAEDAGAIYGKPYNGTYKGFFSAVDASITDNTVSITCPEPTIITRIAADSYDYYKYKTSPNGEWIGPVHQFDVECEFVSNNGVVVIPISSNNYYGKAYFSAYENLDITNKIVIPPFIDTDGIVKYSDNTVALGSTNSATGQSLAVGNRNSAYSQSLAVGGYNSATSNSVSLGYYNRANYYSQSLGSDNYSNQYSLAFGYHSSANYYSLAGGQAASSYYYSLALGPATSAASDSLSLGERSYANDGSLAVGYYNSATQRSMAVGYSNSAYNYSFAMGGSKASNYSIAAGNYTRAENCSQSFGAYTSATNSGMAIGTYNNIATAAFVVGNGSAYNAHSDAFVIFHDGSVSAAGKISANGVELGAGGGGGDAEVNNYVYTNSAAINGTVSTYQTNSASYITELPDEEEVEFEEINLSSFATSSQVNYLSGAIDYVSANAGGTDWTDTISSLSGQINEISGTLSGKHTLSAGEGISFYEDNENNITRIDCTATGGGTSLTGDFSGNGQPITFTDKDGKILYSDKFVLTNDGFSSHVNGDYGFYHDLSLNTYDGISAYDGTESMPEIAWGLNSAGVCYVNSVNHKTWYGVKNTDLGLTTGSTISSISGHSLAVGDVSNIVLTSTLPATPDANTLYLIPEA